MACQKSMPQGLPPLAEAPCPASRRPRHFLCPLPISRPPFAGATNRMASPDPRPAYGGLPVMIWTSGPDRRCDYFNERWLEFTGRRLEEELGWGWAERVHPDDLKRAVAASHAAFDERRP